MDVLVSIGLVALVTVVFALHVRFQLRSPRARREMSLVRSHCKRRTIAWCDRHLADCVVVVGKQADCMVVVGKLTDCMVVVGKLTDCMVVVGKLTDCMVVVGKLTDCMVVVGKLTDCMVVVGK